ncbi:hypothetical protein JW890_02975 [candidate division WOR-3 bacterium]|nr:hypothetical protein [candidate division WOR-3 bacterium]
MKKLLFLSMAFAFYCFLGSTATINFGISIFAGDNSSDFDLYYKQTNLDLTDIDGGNIKALVDGVWIEYSTTELPEKFMEWNLSARREAIDMWKRGEMPPLSGPHSGMVASYGGKREDTQISVNNAVKGIGFLPKEEFISQVTELLLLNYDSSFIRKLFILDSLYQNPEIFDRTKQISLELYTTEEFKTHTFLNIMAYPLVSVVFLDIPSYEIKAAAQLIYPEDPSISEQDRKTVEYINTVHDFIHGSSPRKSFALVFHVLEVFDNSPSSRGIRIVP